MVLSRACMIEASITEMVIIARLRASDVVAAGATAPGAVELIAGTGAPGSTGPGGEPAAALIGPRGWGRDRARSRAACAGARCPRSHSHSSPPAADRPNRHSRFPGAPA